MEPGAKEALHTRFRQIVWSSELKSSAKQDVQQSGREPDHSLPLCFLKQITFSL